MDFTKKNDFVVRNKDAKHFEQDMKLFKEHCPTSRLYSDLKRSNKWNRTILDGHMLFELLDKVTPEEILKNREVKSEEPKKPNTVDSIDDIKAIFIEAGVDMDNYEDEMLTPVIGKTSDEIKAFISFGKLFQPTKSKDDKNPKNEKDGNGASDGEASSGNDKQENASTSAEEFGKELSETSNTDESATVQSSGQGDVAAPETDESSKNENVTKEGHELESKEQELEEKVADLEEKNDELENKEAELEEKEAELEEKAEALKAKEEALKAEAKATKKTTAKATTVAKKKASTKSSPE